VSSLSQCSLTHLGMDVHKDSISIGILRPDGSLDVERIFHDEESVRRFIARMGEPRRLVACYEAGRPAMRCSGSSSASRSRVMWWRHRSSRRHPATG
jgi:hypothetical protein